MKHTKQMLNFRHLKIKRLSVQWFQVTSPPCTVTTSSVALKYGCVAPIFCRAQVRFKTYFDVSFKAWRFDRIKPLSHRAQCCDYLVTGRKHPARKFPTQSDCIFLFFLETPNGTYMTEKNYYQHKLSTCGCAGISHLVATPEADGGGVSYGLAGLSSSGTSIELSSATARED